jgi:hypothetical protein
MENQNGKITIDDLAVMGKDGFDNIDEKFERVETRFNNVESKLVDLENEQFELKKGQEIIGQKLDKLEKSQEELKDIVQSVYGIEMINLKKRVEIIERKLDIAN